MDFQAILTAIIDSGQYIRLEFTQQVYSETPVMEHPLKQLAQTVITTLGVPEVRHDILVVYLTHDQYKQIKDKLEIGRVYNFTLNLND